MIVLGVYGKKFYFHLSERLSEVRLHRHSICHVVTINCSNIAYKGMICRNNALPVFNPVLALERAFAGVKIETRIFNFCHIDVSK